MSALAFIDRTNERKLPSDYRGDIIVFDIDKTYLDTNLSSARALLAIPFELAIDKRAIPGVRPLLRALRRGPKEESALVPLYFVSASPRELRGVLERRMVLDGVDYDGITLKDQLGLLLSRRFGLLREQLSYKVAALMLYRRELPREARWLMFGDDVEEDLESFLLFGKIAAGLRGPALERALSTRGVEASVVRELVALASALPEGPDPVERVFIHQTRAHPRSVNDPRVVIAPSYLETALVLAKIGRIRAEAIGAVAKDLRRNLVPEPRIAELLRDAEERFGIPADLIEHARQSPPFPA